MKKLIDIRIFLIVVLIIPLVVVYGLSRQKNHELTEKAILVVYELRKSETLTDFQDSRFYVDEQKWFSFDLSQRETIVSAFAIYYSVAVGKQIKKINISIHSDNTKEELATVDKCIIFIYKPREKHFKEKSKTRCTPPSCI